MPDFSNYSLCCLICFSIVSLVKTNTFLQTAVLALIILIPNVIAKEKTEKCHLYFSQREESAQKIWNLFLGFGTHLKVGIDFRFNAFFILQDRAKTFAVQRNSIRNIISDKFFYQLKLEKNIKKEYVKLTTNIATLMFQSSVETFYSCELIEVISFWGKKRQLILRVPV